MCGYSNEAAAAERGVAEAKKGETLVHHSHGFSSVADPGGPLVCLRSGTELLLTAKEIDWFVDGGYWGEREQGNCDDLPVRFEEREVGINWSANGKPTLAMMDIMVRADGRFTTTRFLHSAKVKVLQLPPQAKVRATAKLPENELV
jgi:hypothetical protein